MTIGYSVNSSIDIPDFQQKKSSIDCLFHLTLFLDIAEMAKYVFLLSVAQSTVTFKSTALTTIVHF